MTSIQRKITDFQPSNEGMVVSRVLVSVHKAIDDAFPNSRARERQFTKTIAVFGGPSEKTGLFPAEDKVPPPPSSIQPSKLDSPPEKISAPRESTKRSVKAKSKKVEKKRRVFDTVFIVTMYVLIAAILIYVFMQYAETVFFLHP